MLVYQRVCKKIPGTLKFFPFKSLSFAIVEQVAAVWTFSKALLGLGSLAANRWVHHPTMWGPPSDVCWFINPINYSYKYHKP